MTRDYKILAIIPARGGSKSIPHKNIMNLVNKPLIAYTIEFALRSSSLDRVIVSTDDEEIANIAKEYGAEVPFIRPSYLATDSAPTLIVLQHAVKYLEEKEKYKPDIIVTLQPTSPLRDEKDIDKAVKKLLDTKADSVVSVCKADHHPYWMKRLEGDRVYPFIDTNREYTRRQDLPPTYRLNGAVYITRRDVLMEENKVLGNDTRAIIMSREQSVDIDDWVDFKLAEILIEEREGCEESKDR